MTRVKGISIIVLVVAVASDAARLQEDPSSTSSLQGPASRRVKRVRRDSEAATSHWASVYSRSSGVFFLVVLIRLHCIPYKEISL